MNWKTRSDPSVVRACLAGDAAAWEALIVRYQGFICSIALRFGLSHADADDVFQNVSLKLCLHLAELRDQERLAAWIGAVTRQECVRLVRRRREVQPLDDALEIPTDDTVTEILLHEERVLEVRQALQTLAEECRQLLGLLYSDEPKSYAEVAAILEMPIGSIGPKRARCLERLKKKLETSEF